MIQTEQQNKSVNKQNIKEDDDRSSSKDFDWKEIHKCLEEKERVIQTLFNKIDKYKDQIELNFRKHQQLKKYNYSLEDDNENLKSNILKFRKILTDTQNEDTKDKEHIYNLEDQNSRLKKENRSFIKEIKRINNKKDKEIRKLSYIIEQKYKSQISNMQQCIYKNEVKLERYKDSEKYMKESLIKWEDKYEKMENKLNERIEKLQDKIGDINDRQYYSARKRTTTPIRSSET
jgi:chromosome segregation ATPase